LCFIEKEVKEAIFEMKHNKAPSLDGFFLLNFIKISRRSLMRAGWLYLKSFMMESYLYLT
jgi:hypothetical protein